MSGPNRELFWNKVDRSGDCWEWQAFRDKDGYGVWGWREEDRRWKNVRAHRFAYEEVVGEIPEGLQIDHLCRNPSCVNPDHLEPVTARENTLRGVGITARHAKQTHCHQGHEFTDDNTYINPSGSRVCKQCRRKIVMAYYYRKQAKAA